MTENQYESRKGKSSGTNLVFYSRAIDIIQETDSWADTTYLDLNKAFDRVPHR